MNQYTRQGYEAASKSFIASDMNVNCSGKSFMLSGANSGLGKAMALDIAKRGGTVHLVCRNLQSAEMAKEDIIQISGNNDIHVYKLDLSMPRNVVEFGKMFSDNNDSLDVLVNNAGCMVHARKIDDDGLEINFATNTLGTYLLTKTLIPLLSKSKQPRVIIVSSGGMLKHKLNVDDWQLEKQEFNGTQIYGQNKRQQVVIAQQLALCYPKIHFSSMHPGWADTPAVRSAMPEFYNKMKDKLRNAEQGADTATWLAISNAALKFPSGLFFEDRRPVPAHLPFAWTRSTNSDCLKFLSKLDNLANKFQ